MTTNAFAPLVVPATIANQETIRQLLLYCDQVFLYAPDEGARSDLPPEFDGLCRHHAPAPFGDQLPNFEQLIRDMTGHRAEYYGGGLSSLSAAVNGVDEESVWKLIRRLSPAATGAAEQQEALLQARLLLKLAEVREREEQEIAETLAALEAQGQSLLHGLTGGDDEEGNEIEALIGRGGQQTEETVGKRLRAWAHLFLADPKMGERWLLAGSPEVLAMLADYATSSLIATPAHRILSLPYPKDPLNERDPARHLAARTAWHQTAGKLIKKAQAAILAAAETGKTEACAAIEQEVQAWFDHSPAWAGEPKGSLDVMLLPISLPRLFAKIARHPEPPAAKKAPAYGVVAVPN